MNREEAQFILGACRPDGEDAQDPQYREALALAGRDPVLARWLAEERAFDRALSAKLRARAVPPDLAGQLLLARATVRRLPRWRQPVWLAMAAALALLLAVGALFLPRGGAGDEFAAFRTAMLAPGPEFGGHADVWGLDNAGYRTWLASHRGDPNFVLPRGLADKGISACKVVAWRGRQVTMLCVKFGGQHVDLFVLDAEAIPGHALGAMPAMFAVGEVNAAAWLREGKLYLLAGTVPATELRALL
ncbi:MAG: hypothetical protein Q8N18_23055 [Opitutaceae bacterium]|nr:hypothetical protein [Opitutaceae bacterium]